MKKAIFYRKIITCKSCGEKKPHIAKGLCNACYKKQWKPKLIICKKCGEEKPQSAKGLCCNCYNKSRKTDETRIT